MARRTERNMVDLLSRKKKKGKPVFLTFIKEPTMGDVPILHFVFGYGINTW